MSLRISVAAATDVGRVRGGNEDSYLAADHVVAVADGMGGHQAGEVASALAVDALRDLADRTFEDTEEATAALVEAVEQANRVVVERSLYAANLAGMGTTLTAAMVHDDHLIAAHVGDSRAYLLRPGEPMSQLTTDHTLVQRLVAEGRLSRDEAAHHPQRNVITRAIGNEPDVAVDALPPLQLRPGDRVLLCSDGLTGPVSDEEIQTLVDAVGGGQDAVDALVAAANEAGGPDNITVVLLEVLGGPDMPATVGAGTSSASEGATTTTPTHGSPVPAAGTAADRDGRVPVGDTEDADWAETVGRYGAPDDGGALERRRRAPRILAGLLGAVVLLGLLGGGAWLLLSRAYFVGEYDGRLAVYRGLADTVVGVPLYWVVDGQVSDVPVDSLPAFRQDDVADGLTVSTLREARQVIARFRAEAEAAQEAEPSAAPTQTPQPPGSQAPGADPPTTSGGT